jgi:hypothetical protein
MPQTYSDFTTTEQGGHQYIIAQPKAEHKEPVRFSGELEETDDIDATFRDVIKSLIQQDLSEALNLESGSGGSIGRHDVVETLMNADAPVPINSEQQAEAIIDYFLVNGVLQEADNGSEVVVLSDPESLAEIATESSDDDDTAMLLNWMSAIEGCTTKIQETNDTIEEVEAELRDQMGNVDVSGKLREYRQNRKEVAQRLMNVTNGGELNRSDLSPDEQAEYDRLEHRMFHLESMIDAVGAGGDLDQEIQEMTNKLSMHMSNLSDTQDALEVQLSRLERVYRVNDEINYEQAKKMAENLSSVASAVAGVADADTLAEETDTMSRASAILEETGSTEEMAQAASTDTGAVSREQGN